MNSGWYDAILMSIKIPVSQIVHFRPRTLVQNNLSFTIKSDEIQLVHY